jgi:hypothetical protein
MVGTHKKSVSKLKTGFFVLINKKALPHMAIAIKLTGSYRTGRLSIKADAEA